MFFFAIEHAHSIDTHFKWITGVMLQLKLNIMNLFLINYVNTRSISSTYKYIEDEWIEKRKS